MSDRIRSNYRIEQSGCTQHLILDTYFMGNVISSVDIGSIDLLMEKIKLYDTEYSHLLKQNEYIKSIANDYEKLTSVLDEIREVINQNISSYSSCIKAFDEIEVILDKVK